jgi:O-antigen ligase
MATFTLNIRKVFLGPYSFLQGTFNEYLTINLSWADILMIGVIIIYTTKLIYRQISVRLSQRNISGNNKPSLSIFFLLNPTSRETIFLALFFLWVGLSIFWSQYKPIAFYRFIIFVEIATFIFIAIKSIAQQKWLRLALLAVIINGLFQSILAITQFIHNRSLGFRAFGESVLGLNIDGVAKIIIDGEKHIRAYGTFSHPNILAGFLLIPIFIIFTELFKKFISTRNNNYNISRETLFRRTPLWLIIIIFLVLVSGSMLTLSRSAFLGLIFGMIIFGFLNKKYLSNYLRLSILSIILLATFSFCFFLNSNKIFVSILSTQSLEERNLYQTVARETISMHPLKGVGVGQFVFNEIQNYLNLKSWQYQPVHNVYLLIFSELGIVGLTLFLFYLVTILIWDVKEKYTPNLKLTYATYYCIIFSFLFIFLFDHYFWDIKIGVIIFALPVLFLKTISHREV